MVENNHSGPASCGRLDMLYAEVLDSMKRSLTVLREYSALRTASKKSNNRTAGIVKELNELIRLFENYVK